MDFELIKRALADALGELGITEYEMYYMSSSESSVGTLNREVNSSSSGVHGGICLRVLVDGRLGYAATELMTAEEMRDLASRALDNARFVEKEAKVGIFAGSPEYEESRLDEYTPMSSEQLRTCAVKLGESLFSKDERVREGTESQAVSMGFDIRLVNSHGLDLYTSVGVNVAIAEAIVASGDESQSAYAIDRIADGELDASVARATDKAVDEALSKIGAGLLDSGRYNVIISGKQMRSLLSVFSSAFSARSVLDGVSMLKDKLGESIASEAVTITDDPQREGNTIGTAFDAEGVATHRRAVVDKGTLLTYLHNRETAAEMNTESTANASKADYSSPIAIRPYSFCIEPGEYGFDELLQLVGEGVYITELKGLHAGANAVSGDFSLESAGFVIKNGRIDRAVRSFTVAGNFFELLKSITAVSDELELGVATGFTGFGSPAVLVRELSIAGK